MEEARSLQEWIDFYELKTGDKVQVGNSDRHLFYLPERGFCELSIDRENSTLWVYGVVGDGKFWHDFALMEADGQGLNKIKTYTLRDIKVLFRIYGGRKSYYNINGHYCCHDRNGRLITAVKSNNGQWLIETFLKPDDNYESDGNKNVE